MLEHATPGTLLFCLLSKLIVWHSGEKYKRIFHSRAEVVRMAKDLTSRGVVKCVICGRPLSVHGAYRRHYRDDEGNSHDGWVAQGHCATCNVFPSLIPSFLMPHKHFSAEVIESALKRSEGGPGLGSGDCPANDSTIYRWISQFRERGTRAVGWLLSTLLAVFGRHVSMLELRNRGLLGQLGRLVREFPVPEGAWAIGSANIVLTMYKLGFL